MSKRRNNNSGYIGVDKRTAKAGSYGAEKHYLERLGGNFGVVLPAAPGGVLENVAVVGNTATLEAITDENEGFIAYNDETFALWVASDQTTAAITIYAKQDSGI